MPDQLLMYDSAVKDWATALFGSLIPDKSMTVMVGTPDRAFAEYVTPLGPVPYGVMPVPRMAITLGDPEENSTLFNPNDIRLLGYTDDTKLKIRKAEYPVSVKIPYTLNFWTEYTREMNLIVQKSLKTFRLQYRYIPVDIDSISPISSSVYGKKDIGLFIDGSIANSGNLDPDEGERISRRTLSLHMNAFLWDYEFSESRSVKDVKLGVYSDRNLTALIEMKETPTRYVMFIGTGAVHFNGTLRTIPAIANTITIDAVISGSPVRLFDDGLGNIIPTTLATGTINYTDGTLDIVFVNPPDNGENISVAYYTKL